MSTQVSNDTWQLCTPPLHFRRYFSDAQRTLEDIGFLDLKCYSDSRYRATNFVHLYKSPDDLTIVELSFARLRMLPLFLLIFVNPHLFIRYLFGVYALVLTSVTDSEDLLLHTTSHSELSRMLTGPHRRVFYEASVDDIAVLIKHHSRRVLEYCLNTEKRLFNIHDEKTFFTLCDKVRDY